MPARVDWQRPSWPCGQLAQAERAEQALAGGDDDAVVVPATHPRQQQVVLPFHTPEHRPRPRRSPTPDGSPDVLGLPASTAPPALWWRPGRIAEQEEEEEDRQAQGRYTRGWEQGGFTDIGGREGEEDQFATPWCSQFGIEFYIKLADDEVENSVFDDEQSSPGYSTNLGGNTGMLTHRAGRKLRPSCAPESSRQMPVRTS